jgi:hypothetical protein
MPVFLFWILRIFWRKYKQIPAYPKNKKTRAIQDAGFLYKSDHKYYDTQPTHDGLSLNFYRLGTTRIAQLGVAALAKGSPLPAPQEHFPRGASRALI